jgi:hypothetical protein
MPRQNSASLWPPSIPHQTTPQPIASLNQPGIGIPGPSCSSIGSTSSSFLDCQPAIDHRPAPAIPSHIRPGFANPHANQPSTRICTRLSDPTNPESSRQLHEVCWRWVSSSMLWWGISEFSFFSFYGARKCGWERVWGREAVCSDFYTLN